ncbi:transposase [Bradyrhizobium sp. CCBAU 51627]|uniref:transposase n=1 Tax=Bradyrhizobium sp. CCBAU 51627 TaxID=1325088 RepID=UPI002304D231|nr:transposase [Bradyrhizobium sp. CCBAU 51627]
MGAHRVSDAFGTIGLEGGVRKANKAVLAILRDDAVCRRLMTVPGVGPLVAVTYKSAIDDPRGIVNSKAAGALFGLTPKKLPIRRKRCQADSRWPETR